MIQIIITKSTFPSYWYHNHIGQVLNVFDDGHDQWYIPMNDGLMFIRKDDSEIFDRKKKLERIKNKMKFV